MIFVRSSTKVPGSILQSEIPSLPTANTPPSSVGATFLASQTEIHRVSDPHYIPTRISAEETEKKQIRQCFNSRESSERAEQLRRIFSPLMPCQTSSEDISEGILQVNPGGVGGGGYGGLVGQSLNRTLTKLVHAMDDKLPVDDKRVSLMLLSIKSFFEKCANNDVNKLTAGHRRHVYQVGVASLTVDGDDNVTQQETFTESNSTKACSLEITRLLTFALRCVMFWPRNLRAGRVWSARSGTFSNQKIAAHGPKSCRAGHVWSAMVLLHKTFRAGRVWSPRMACLVTGMFG